MDYFGKTKRALLSSSFLNEPLTLLYAWLPFIMRKDLDASSFQIALVLMLRPVMSIISFYWSFNVENNTKKLRTNLVLSGILARAPFLFCLFIDNVWFLILASAIHMLFLRGGMPAWMEILKLNLPKEHRQKLFSLSSTLGYIEGVLLALGMGALMDTHSQFWKIFLFAGAILGLITVAVQWRLPIRGEAKKVPVQKDTTNRFLKPWINSYELMRSRPDFAHYQWGFMIGGFGIMLIATALPLFFVDVLQLSHTNFATARSVCMGLGFAFSSALWARALSRFSIPRITAAICLGFAIFPLLLVLAPQSLTWLYLAYIVYGVTQGGSHIVWHLSGPLFAKNGDSSTFSGVNVVMVGIRGLIAPLASNVLCVFFGPQNVLLLGAFICLSGMLFMLTKRRYETALS